ncbi:MAG: zinc ribbon domain-containing protein [Bacilli bacterium]|nr:zinc ribbon domain-containing protein [Bacilli bacterium]
MKKQNSSYIILIIFILSISLFSNIPVVFGNFTFLFVLLGIFTMFGTFKNVSKGVKKTVWDDKTGKKKTCTHCLKLIPVEAVYCPVCGKNVEKTVICDYCGEANPEGILQCEKCKGLL